MSESSADRNSFEMLAEEFSERLRRGEHPSLTEYVERYPEHAEDIRDLFPALALVEQFKPAPQEVNGAAAATSPPGRGSIPEQLGDYRILRWLGEGGMGVVYEAVRESLHSHVALKVMHPHYRNRPNYLRRFHTEARSAARLHHTNIVSVFDYGEHDGVCYYAMQFIAGQSLDKVLDDIRQLRLEKEGLPLRDTVTLACHTDGRLADVDIGREDNARCATNSLGRTIALGLLTGRFATAGADESSGKHDTPLPSEMAIAPVEDVADMGAATRCFGSELPQTELRTHPPHELAPGSETAPDSATIPAHDKRSSLAGKADIRYYREVARLGAQVADALAYAHNRGVLHRDIKPPNLVLDPLGNIWVTDFGLAKFEEGDDLSQSQDLAGTLRYMSPERFKGLSDRRGDVYALGATLYELLTLRPAFQGQDQLELIRRVENEPPVPPRQLDRKIPLDLETIVLKALAKVPSDRFASAAELAAELRRFVDNRPIHSRPIPYYQQFGRWCKRNPWLAAANVTAAALTTILAIVSTVAAFIYYDRNQQAVWDNRRIQHAENGTRQQLFGALQAQARAGRFSRQMGQRFDSLAALEKAAGIARDLKLPRERFDRLRDEAIACLALPDLKPTGRVITMPPGAMFAFDSTMTRYALRFRDGTIPVRRVTDDTEIARFQAQGDREIFVFGFSPDGRYLATTNPPSGALTVWDVDRRAVALNAPGHWWARFSPDSQRIAVQHEGKTLIYDLTTSQVIRSWGGAAPGGGPVFRPDGAQIAVVYSDHKNHTCRILDADTGRLVQSIPLPAVGGAGVWSPDGTTLAIAGVEDSKPPKIYLWDAATGTRKATLEGSTNNGINTAFHPAGTLLASHGWEGRLRLWDPMLGRLWLSVTGYSPLEFSQDGRIVLQTEDKLTTYQVDPALEYRTFAHASSQRIDHHRPSIRHDGRLLAVGTDQGVAIWDLARGTELAFLPIGLAWATTFEPSGDLLTSGSPGVWRWPVKIGTGRDEYQIGPPRRLPLPSNDCGISLDRSGQIVALANYSEAWVLTPDRRFRVGPLDDCRYVAVSPDGEWLATGNHEVGGARVWRIRDGTEAARLAIEGGTGVSFSPDGKWLVAGNPRPRLWEVGTWREVPQITAVSGCFSPDGRLVVVLDPSRVLRLVEIETQRTLARLESPDRCGVVEVIFSPDGSRLVVTTNEPPSVHVWDLRAIRKHLTEMGLDWDAPAYPDDDPAGPSALPLHPIPVDCGRLRIAIEHLEQNAVPAEDLVARQTERLKARPDDPDSLHQRGHALLRLQRFDQALADFSAASARRPLDGHLRAYRGVCLYNLKQYAPALDQLESAFRSDPESVRAILSLGTSANKRAWELATGPKPQRDPALAARLAEFAVALAPGEQGSLNTLGVALYRAGNLAEAITTLEKSLAAGKGQFAAFDLFFLAVAHHRLGHRPEARACYDRAVRWVADQKTLPAQHANELAAFRAETEAVLASQPGDLPVEVFAPDQGRPNGASFPSQAPKRGLNRPSELSDR
jgi:eukaryotic-like serine/threonine-protein kinase